MPSTHGQREHRRRIAIVQESFGVGGRERVIWTMVEVLNEMGIVPDICVLETLQSDFPLDEVYGAAVNYRIRFLPNLIPQVISGIRAPYINWVTNWVALFGYDGIINMTGSMAFCWGRLPMLFYINVPESYIVLRELPGRHRRGTLLQEARRTIHMALIRRFDAPKDNMITVCNSRNVLELLRAMYPETHAEVLYPPVDLRRFSDSGARKKQIINLGRYSPIKRQLDLISLADRLPDYRIVCIGPGQSNDYYRACARYVADHGLSTVELLPTVPFVKLKELLEESMFYVHLFPQEPFGLATVEAIAAGCMPIVPDSWGNQEIVCVPQLRYSESGQIVDKIRELENCPETMQQYRKSLKSHIRQYDQENFKSEFRRLVDRTFGEHQMV